jgi:hypothetical protein
MCFAARIAVKKKLESADCTPGLLLDERDRGFSRFLHEEHELDLLPQGDVQPRGALNLS